MTRDSAPVTHEMFSLGNMARIESSAMSGNGRLRVHR